MAFWAQRELLRCMLDTHLDCQNRFGVLKTKGLNWIVSAIQCNVQLPKHISKKYKSFFVNLVLDALLLSQCKSFFLGQETNLLLNYLSECATPNKFRTAGSQKDGSNFFQRSDSNPGWLGGKRECSLCAMPSPRILDLMFICSLNFSAFDHSALDNLESRKTNIG